MTWFAFPVAWYLGNDYLARCQAAGIEPDSSGVLGRLIGKVMTFVQPALVLFLLLVIGAAAAASPGPYGVRPQHPPVSTESAEPIEAYLPGFTP